MSDEMTEIEAPAEEAKGELETLLNDLIAVVKHCYEKVSALEDLVVNKFIGGINKLYDDNQRVMSIGELRKSHGGLFEDLMPAYLEDNEGVDDIFDRIYDLTKGLDKEAIAGKVQEVADALRKRYTSLREKIPEVKAAVVEAAPEKVEEKVEEKPPELSAEDELVEDIKRQKKRGGKGYIG